MPVNTAIDRLAWVQLRLPGAKPPCRSYPTCARGQAAVATQRRTLAQRITPCTCCQRLMAQHCSGLLWSLRYARCRCPDSNMCACGNSSPHSLTPHALRSRQRRNFPCRPARLHRVAPALLFTSRRRRLQQRHPRAVRSPRRALQSSRRRSGCSPSARHLPVSCGPSSDTWGEEARCV